MVSTPKHWLPNFHQTGAPFALPRWPRGVLSARRKGVSTFCRQRSPPGPFPSHLLRAPLFCGGESCQRAPLPQHAPLRAHPPRGLQARAHRLLCPELSGQSSRFETESKEEAGRGSAPRPVARSSHPRPAPAPPHSRRPPRAATPPGGGKASLRASGAPTSAGPGPGPRAGPGWGGRVRAGAARSAVSPAPARSSSRARTGALSCAARSPPPRRAWGSPRAEWPAVPPPRRRPPAPRLVPHCVPAPAAGPGGREAAAAAARAEQSPRRRRRRHSPIVRMRGGLHMLASDRRPASGPLTPCSPAGLRVRYPAGPAACLSQPGVGRAPGARKRALRRAAAQVAAAQSSLALQAGCPRVFEVLQELGAEVCLPAHRSCRDCVHKTHRRCPAAPPHPDPKAMTHCVPTLCSVHFIH